jgi:hypothetical protein
MSRRKPATSAEAIALIEAARGDIANLYRAGPGLLKFVRHPADNDLMRRETEALTQLRDQADARFCAYFPRLVQAGRHEDPRSGIQRRANLIGALTGFRSPADTDPSPCRPRDLPQRRAAMGSGRWSTSVYDAAARFRAATGASAFAYSDSGAGRVHPSLDPFGVSVRECRDSGEHPQSLAIAVLFDVTGSMRHVPRTLQAKLPQLLGLLLRKGYVTHPQIMFGAIGDATCDRAPLQVGQFESDNRMDDDLGRILLEGGGGGQKTESYELALYFMARHTAADCYAKRGRRGYLFIIGDEMAYPGVKPAEVREVIGDGLQAGLPFDALVAEVTAKWDTYYILPAGASYAGDRQVLGFWRDRLGQNVIELADLDAVCETIALTVGLGENAISLDDGLDDLGDVGSAAGPAVSKALAVIGAGRDPSTALQVAAAPDDLDGPSGNVRL